MPGVVVTHPEWGIFVGISHGFGFFSKLDAAGQDRVTFFDDEDQAKHYVAALDIGENRERLTFVPVAKAAEDHFATIEDLVNAGLSDMLGELLLNVPAMGNA